MGEEYEALGPAGAVPPAPPTVQFPVPQPPSPFPPSPGQPEVFQFPSQASPSTLASGEQKKQFKKDGIGDSAKKEKKEDEEIEQSATISNVRCLVASLILIIMAFIGITLVIFLIVLLYTNCFGSPTCSWLKVFKFF
ncbi:hypothetical protein QQG55_29080 [Brugia pahangi]